MDVHEIGRRLRSLVDAPVQDGDVVPALDEPLHDRYAARAGAADHQDPHEALSPSHTRALLPERVEIEVGEGRRTRRSLDAATGACDAALMAKAHSETRIPPRLVVGLVLALLILVFIAENNRRTKMRFLLPEVTAPLWTALFAAASAGRNCRRTDHPSLLDCRYPTATQEVAPVGQAAALSAPPVAGPQLRAASVTGRTERGDKMISGGVRRGGGPAC